MFFLLSSTPPTTPPIIINKIDFKIDFNNNTNIKIFLVL